MLKSCYLSGIPEAGLDEAGRGCLAGPVYAAAVILPPDFHDELLNDSKQLSEKKRYRLRELVEREALAWAVGVVDNQEIDRINILRASILAMHRAVDKLSIRPEHLIVDGNRFYAYKDIPHTTVVKGDATYMSIAAASILAKTYRDDFMLEAHQQYPQYHWDKNKGYPAKVHREAIAQYGPTPLHRMSFNLLGNKQMELQFD
ncbi:MAG: ribonuclease HII [Bacteroidaceae bacterium]|nr:ribonuclease HII [Bacteroidaceae bacterium]